MFRILTLSWLFWVFFTVSAVASTITSDGSVVTYDAASGESNRVLVSESSFDTACGGLDTPCLKVWDSGAHITQATGGCVVTATSTITGDEAACPLPQVVAANLGDRDDSLWDWDGPTLIDAGAGNDNPIEAMGGHDVLHGGAGSDLLVGGAGDDVTHGGPGDDYFDGIPGGYPDESWTHGSDTYIGGGGIDAVTYETRTEDLTLSPDGVADDGAAGEGDDIATDIRIVYGGEGSDTMTGNDDRNDFSGGSGDDVIAGNGGADQLAGGLGDDLLAGNDGTDVLEGGDGHDTLVGGADVDRFWGDDLFTCSALLCASGQDQIFARDGEIEGVNCGPDEDTAEVDEVEAVYNPGIGSDQCELVDGLAPQGGSSGGPSGAGGGPAPAPGSGAGGGFRVARAAADRRGRIVLRVTVPGPGRLSARAKARRLKVARASRSVDTAGEVTLSLKASRQARRALRSRRRLKVKVTTVFTPGGGGAASVLTSAVTLKGAR